MKTTTQPKKRGRPVGSKNKVNHSKGWDNLWEKLELELPDSEATVEQIKNAARLLEEPKMSLANKITLVLTVVNVAILISLVIKNV